MSNERFGIYSMDKYGHYGDPVWMVGITATISHAVKEAKRVHEVRVTDTEDCLIFHIVDKKVIWPDKKSIFPHILQLLVGLEIVEKGSPHA